MILAIDTSVGTAVAVVELDGVVRSAAASTETLRHAEIIGDLLVAALAEASAEPGDITYVAAGMGPGPFTGLRIGIAAARAFALGRGIPIIPVVSHDAVALSVLLHDMMTLQDATADAGTGRIAVVTDARRREVAYTVYEGIDDDGLPVRITEPALAPRVDVDERLREAHAERYDADAVPAAMVGLIAARARAAGRPVASPEPLYLRSPDVTVPSGPKRVTS